MNLTRTTLRLDPELKRQAEHLAVEENITLQEVFNLALKKYLETEAKAQAQAIVFQTHDLGEPLDSLERADFYGDPEYV